VSDDSAEERARVAEEATRRAHEAAASAKERAKGQADRLRADALTGQAGEEAVRQTGSIYGRPHRDRRGHGAAAPGGSVTRRLGAKSSVIAFSVAFPLLAALLMVDRQEVFRRRRTPSMERHHRSGARPVGCLRRHRRRLLAHLLGRWRRVPRSRARRGAGAFGGMVASGAGSWPAAEWRKLPRSRAPTRILLPRRFGFLWCPSGRRLLQHQMLGKTPPRAGGRSSNARARRRSCARCDAS
jgi:hypothetical protein